MLTPTISRAIGGVDPLRPIVDDHMKIRMGNHLIYLPHWHTASISSKLLPYCTVAIYKIGC